MRVSIEVESVMGMVGIKKQGLESCRDLRITKAHEMYVIAVSGGCGACQPGCREAWSQ